MFAAMHYDLPVICDHDDDELFMVWLNNERRLALFPAGTNVTDLHHCESRTRHEPGLNLCRT